MKHAIVRTTLIVLEAFIALTAIITGMAVLINGPSVIQMPLEWLRNTPFSDYTIPMLILVIVVGGSSLVAAATVFIRREWSVLLSAAAGLMMVGFEVVQIALIQKLSWLQGLYLVLGVAIFALATYLWMTEYRSRHMRIGHVGHA
jgi:intracellular septation protein A